MMDRCAAMREAMHEPELRAKLFAGNFGMRMQAHRVLTDGRASRYPYPSQLGSRVKNPYLTSGISDNLMEFNAVIVKGSEAAVRQLQILQQIVDRQMESQERLWPLTMPPALVYKDDLDFLSYNCSRPDQKDFYHYLVGKYGIKSLLMGGVHVGYGLDKQLLEEIYHRFYQDKYRRQADFQNHLYFKLAQGFYRWQWLFTYLFGASPVATSVKDIVAPELEHQVRSFRNSKYGFTNLPNEQVDYSSLDAYINSLADYLENGTYQNFHEYFGPVCLHGRTSNLEKTINDGVQYISMRGFDTDPFSKAGISEDTLNFLELVMIYTLLTETPDDMADKVRVATERNEQAALQEPTAQEDWMKEEGLDFVNQLEAFCEEYDAPRKYRLALKFVQRRIEDPSLTIAGQMASKMENGMMLSFGLKVANDRYLELVQSSQPLAVIAKGYSVTAQELIRAAIVLGIQVWLDHGVRFNVGDHEELLPADVDLPLEEGPQQYLLNLFPEVGNE